MRIALISTTINVPKVLQLYRKLGPDVGFFVTGDNKTPHEMARLTFPEGPGVYLNTEAQKALGYQSSELVGWDNDSRRNIALLEALKWGAEIIVSVDDDMIPLSKPFYEIIERALSMSYFGPQFGSAGYWFDAGRFIVPRYRQRGLPLGYSEVNEFSTVVGAEIGVWQGIIEGVPDTDAMTMATQNPIVTNIDSVLQQGFVVHPRALAVFNSQFTAFRRELAPAFAQFYKWQGRNTDIFASLIMRRVMRELNLYTYFGPPIGFHARSQRNPLKDIKAEMFGLENVVHFSQWLEDYVYMSDDASAFDMVHRIWTGMSKHILPEENIDCALAWLEDVSGVL